jgi:hypothetical protein
MKTQIIYLDSYDDYASARDKLGWSQAPRIVLVWPARGKVLSRRLDLVLLQRYSADRGGQPERDEIPVDFSPSWQSAGSPSTSRRGILAILLVVVLIAAIAFVTVPSADIRLAMPGSTAEALLEIPLTPESSGGRTIPTQPFRYESLVIEASARIPTSGDTRVPSTTAEGSVVFTLLGSDPLTIPRGTLLSTSGDDPVRFATRELVTLSPGDQDSAEVAIVADNPGPTGNVGENTITEVIDLSPDLVEVINPQPIAGGGSIERPAVSEGDLSALFQNVSEDLMRQARHELDEQLIDGEVIPSGAIVIESVRQEEYDHHVGDVTDTVELVLALEIGGYIIDQAALDDSISDALRTELPIGWLLIPDTVRYDIQIVHDDLPDPDELTMEIHATQTIAPVIDEAGIHQVLRLRPISEAVGILEDEIEVESPPTIEIYPSWFPLMPILEGRLQIHQELTP